MNDTDFAIGTALAGSAIGTALLESLFDAQILTLDQSRDILDRALSILGPVMQHSGEHRAVQVIAALQKGKFAAQSQSKLIRTHEAVRSPNDVLPARTESVEYNFD
jgi:hypothetical protein